MNIVLSVYFFLSAVFVLFRKICVSFMEWVANDDRVIRFLGIGSIILFLPMTLWLISLPDVTKVLWKLILLVVSIFAILEGLIFLIFPDLLKKIINLFLSINYYLWAIPSALICLLISLFLLASK